MEFRIIQMPFHPAEYRRPAKEWFYLNFHTLVMARKVVGLNPYHTMEALGKASLIYSPANG